MPVHRKQCKSGMAMHYNCDVRYVSVLFKWWKVFHSFIKAALVFQVIPKAIQCLHLLVSSTTGCSSCFTVDSCGISMAGALRREVDTEHKDVGKQKDGWIDWTDSSSAFHHKSHTWTCRMLDRREGWAWFPRRCRRTSPLGWRRRSAGILTWNNEKWYFSWCRITTANISSNFSLTSRLSKLKCANIRDPQQYSFSPMARTPMHEMLRPLSDKSHFSQGFGSAFFLRIRIRIRAKIFMRIRIRIRILGVSGGGGWG